MAVEPGKADIQVGITLMPGQHCGMRGAVGQMSEVVIQGIGEENMADYILMLAPDAYKLRKLVRPCYPDK